MRIVAISSVLSHLARKDFKSSFLCSASVPPSCVQRHGAWVSPVDALGDSQHCHTTKLAPIKQARTNKQGVDMLNCVFQSNIGGAMYNMFQKLSTVLKGNYAYRVRPRPGSSPMHLILGSELSAFTWAPCGWPRHSPSSACQSGDPFVGMPYGKEIQALRTVSKSASKH